MDVIYFKFRKHIRYIIVFLIFILRSKLYYRTIHFWHDICISMEKIKLQSMLLEWSTSVNLFFVQ